MTSQFGLVLGHNCRPRSGILAMLAGTFLLMSCGDSRTPSEGTQDTVASAVVEEGLVTLPALRANRGRFEPLEDAPALVNFQKARSLFAQGKQRSIQVALYALEAAPTGESAIAQRWRELAPAMGLQGAPASPVKKGDSFFADQRPWRLSSNALTGEEQLMNLDLHHHGKDGQANARDFYVTRADQYIKARWQPEISDALYPYKVSYYKNGVGKLGEPPTIKTYQVQVSYSSSIDGLPVIGPGSKVDVSFTLDGQVTAHRASLRKVGPKLRQMTGAALVGPDAAQAEVESRFRSRGVDVSHLRLARAEFGYFSRGRGSVQNVIAPAYAFVYEAREGFETKTRIEVVSAVSDPEVKKTLEQDEVFDNERDAQVLRKHLPVPAGAAATR